MTGLWKSYYFLDGAIKPASYTGVLALGYVGNSVGAMATASVDGCNVNFNLIDLTETAVSPHTDTSYRGGIQSVDKSFSASPILVPLPLDFAVGYDIGFIESAVITIAGVWFDGITGRDEIMEDLRTCKSLVDVNRSQSPYVLLLSNRAYFVMLTGYSSNIIGGQGDVISFRLGLSICSGEGHYI